MSVKQEATVSRQKELQTFLISHLLKKKNAWRQFNKLFLDQLAELKGLYSVYYRRSLWMLVYAKGRRIKTPPHMCTHENTITHKRSCFKPPKKKKKKGGTRQRL